MYVNTGYNNGRVSGPPSPGSDHVSYDFSPPHSPGYDSRKESVCNPTAAAKRYKYLRRVFRFQQMDFQYALWQMLYLFISPQKVYRNFSYRKQSKNQWARDDPAFLVLLSVWLCVTSVVYAVLLRMSFLGFVTFTLWSVFIDCIGVGLLIATLGWFVANKYFLLSTNPDEKVEWGYCFDVHLNAFFPMLIILHGLGAIIYAIAGFEGVIPAFLGNTLIFISLSYYVYVTFLGYDAVPIVRKSRILLYPFTALAIFYIITIILQWNFAQWFHLYNRVKSRR